MRITLFFILVVACAVSFSCRDAKNGKRIPVEDFFATPERTAFKLSPDGKRIAYLGIDHHCQNIFIMGTEDERPPEQLTYQTDRNVHHFFWASDSVLVLDHVRAPTDSLRLYAVSAISGRTWPLLRMKPARLRLLHPRKSYGSYLMAAINARDSSVFDLYRIHLAGSPPELVSQNPGNIADWFMSPDGRARLAVTNDSVRQAILYRPREEAPFAQVALTDYQTQIRPLGYVKNSLTNIYALSNAGRDKLALVEYNTATGREERVIFRHEQVDLEPGGYVPEVQELLFSPYTLDRREMHLLHPGFGKSFNRFCRKFEGQSVDVLDVDTSLTRMIAKVYTDVNAGGTYYYDATTDRVRLLSEMNPKICEANLMPQKPVAFHARDGLPLSGYLTYPQGGKRENLPVVVLVHDGPYRRESIAYDAEVQFLASRGYLVFQPNYRGSAGYGKRFWAAGFREWGGKIQTDIIDGVTWLIHRGIADRDRVAIMGTGFGGYSALHASIHHSSFYRCAVSMSGYVNLFTYFKEIPPHQHQHVLTYHDIIGDPVREADMFKAISPLFQADRVKIPVLFAQGGRDRFSTPADANRFVHRVRNGKTPIRYIYRADEGRKFRNEENRVHYYQEVEAFLAQYLN